MFSSNAQCPDSVSDDSARCVEDALPIRRYVACEKLFAPLACACSACASEDLEWVPSSGVHFQPSPRQNRFPVFEVSADPRQPLWWRVSREIVATGNRRQEAAAT